MIFLKKSHGEYTKVEKPVSVTTSYEGSNDEEEFKTIPVINNNNNVNIVSDSNSDDSLDDIKNTDDNFFDEDIKDQVKAAPQTTINAKVVWSMKKLQAFNNNNTNKIVKQATKKWHQKFKFSNQSGYSSHQHQDCTWRTQDFQQSLGSSQCKFLCEMVGNNLQGVCWHEQAAGVHDQQKSCGP